MYSLIIPSGIELRITEKMDFILQVEINIGMKQKVSAKPLFASKGKSSEAVKKFLRDELGSAVIMYSWSCSICTVKKKKIFF